jgi:NDP-sugar pyrophosphorylase family protein
VAKKGENVKAVLLVGGEGTRLYPLTLNTPKSMVPIANRPFLEHMTEYLKRHGIDDIILTLCYLPDRCQRHFGDGSNFGIKLCYALEDSPLGTAGAVKNVDEHINETFFVFNGDVFTDIDLTAMMEFHRKRGSKATIALTPVEDPTIYGVVETDDEGRVRRFLE